jgi:hypothetical protein
VTWVELVIAWKSVNLGLSESSGWVILASAEEEFAWATAWLGCQKIEIEPPKPQTSWEKDDSLYSLSKTYYQDEI